MTISDKGKKILHIREGFSLKPYLDTKGVPTIAMGNTYYIGGKSVTMKDKPLTLDQANALADTVVLDFARYVNSKIKVSVNQNQFDACVSICYNIGKAGFSSSTFIKSINKNPNDKKIGPEIMLWIKNKELISRRKSEVAQYFGT